MACFYYHQVTFIHIQARVADSQIFHIALLSGTVHTRVEVRRMDLEMSGLVE